MINSFWDLFEECVKDQYDAEQQIVQALPTVLNKVTSSDLRKALENHLVETQQQVRRLAECCNVFGFEPTGNACEAMRGLIAEVNELCEEANPSFTLDAGIIAACQKIEHYEICGYGTLVAFCEALDYNDQAKMMQDSLDEEGEADEKLNDIALDEVNGKAIEEGGGKEGIRARAKTAGARLI